MRGYCVIQFLWDSSPWCFICSSRIHMAGDVSKILDFFDIWEMTCRRFWIISTYGWWRVEYFGNFRHMGDDVSKISEIFDICQAFSSRNLSLLDVPAAVFCGCGGWFLCLQTAVFSGYFFLKICALAITPWKKKNAFMGFSCDFISICEYSLWRRGRLCDIFICAGDQPSVYSIQ